MNVRIVAGSYGGRLIDAPDRRSTHAMSERGRNGMFNSLGHTVQGARVLDAFAGSGAIGLEALSRGAIHATFIEKDRIASKIIGENIALLGVADRAKNIKAPVASWFETNTEMYDLIFADPPYHDMQLSTVRKLFSLLKPKATMILSHTGKGEVPTPNGIVVVDNRSYGNLYLTFFYRIM